jgi:hypothetical protein
MTSLTTSFRVADAHRRFFATKADYLAFKAAWRALLKSELKPSAAFYAAHAVLTGRDLYRAFSPNRRPFEAAPYAALLRALLLIPHLHASRFRRAELESALPTHHAASLLAALAQAGAALQTLPLAHDETRHAIAHGAGRFPVREEPQVA